MWCMVHNRGGIRPVMCEGAGTDGGKAKQGVGVTTSHALNTSNVGWRGQVLWLSLNWENLCQNMLG